MARIQVWQLDFKWDILDLSASVAAKVAVLFRDGIEALLPRVRIEATNHSLRCHEFQVAIHGSETDVRKPLLYPQVYLIGAGMIPAKAEFLQNHGPLFCFSQKSLPVVIIVTITILNFIAWFVKPTAVFSWKMLVLMPCFQYFFFRVIDEKNANVYSRRLDRIGRLSLCHHRYR
jgi:hypothetical protein